MKKFNLVILILMLLVGMAACTERDEPETEPADTTLQTQPVQTQATEAPTEAPETTDVPVPSTEAVYTFPDNASVYGIRLGGMDPEKAWKTLTEAVNGYTLTLTADGEDTVLTAQELGMTCSREKFDRYARAFQNGKFVNGKDVVTAEPAGAVEAYCSSLSSYASDADIRYSGEEGKFVAVSGHHGKGVDADVVTDIVNKAIAEHRDHADVSEACYSWGPDILADDERIKIALREANRYLETELVYTVEQAGGGTVRHPIARKDVASFLKVDDDCQVFVSRSAVEDYVSDMADTYNFPGHEGDFMTTGGFTVGFTVDYYGRGLKQKALADDIVNCLINGTSGLREAPFQEAGPESERPFGGNYLEVSLTDQYLWVYRDGSCVASTPIVSGCVAEGKMTPTGVYAVTDLDTDCWLTGPTWNDYVNYWIGFYRAYGIHDASWRDEFGGDKYIYEGSHGCANMPVDNAGAVFNNVYVGMKVILYGGKQKAEPLQQEITGTESYRVADDAQPFLLDAAPKYEGAKLTYESDNPKVVQVGRDGTVSVQGIGKANITVTAGEFTHHTAAKKGIAVEVYSACEDGRHRFGDWKQTKAPTCQPGEETRTCAVCGKTETREIPATEKHTPGEWKIVQEATCEKPGKRTTVCTVCGAVMEEEIPALGHEFAPDEEFCKHGCGTRNPDYQPPETTTPPGTTVPPETTAPPDTTTPPETTKPSDDD